MLKRPLNPRFSQAVLDGQKFTTIRDTQWPVGTPIMLYNWSGAAYRSKQTDVAAIIVQGFWPIDIAHSADGTMRYACGMENAKPLHETEGFTSRDEMDEWFRKIVKPGQTVRKTLMRFRLLCNSALSAVPADVALSDLWRFLNDKFLEARREYIHCFGKVAGKGPEYFDGYNVALAEVEEWVNAKLTARNAK